MPDLFRDIETRSAADLKVVGAHRYAADPSTEVLCVGYAMNDGPEGIWIPGQPIPEPFVEAARNPDWLVVAHNDAFERVIEEHILHPRFGWPLVPIERHRCTMAMALAAALPGSLEKAIEALDLLFPKDKAGAALMRKMAKPLRGGGWVEDAASLERLYEYCRRDVKAERALYRALPLLIESEQRSWELDATINLRGFYTDGVLLDAGHNVVTQAEAARQAEFRELTGLDSANQTAKLIAWLTERGCIVTDVQKGTLKHALRRKGLADDARRAIELRLELAHASAAKVEALRAWRGDDGRVRGTLGFHGAATGPWVGRGPQPQNFKRDGEDIEAKIAAVMNGGAGLESPIEAVGEIGRAMICAAPGHRLLIADYSGIESRGLAWISRQQSKIDAWVRFDKTGEPTDDPYVIIGRALGHPEGTARAAGKIADLAFGYQGGVGAWKNFAPEDDASNEATIERYRDAWRSQHPATVRFWSALDHAAINAVRCPSTSHQVAGRVAFRYDAPFLRAWLPSGRSISYPFPRLEAGKFGHPRVTFLDNAGGKFADCRFGNGAYGGLWTENIVSGIARDLLAAALRRLEAAGYAVVLHVHDEIVCEAPDGFGTVDEFKHIVVEPPAWAEGLPIAAKVRNGPRFAKSEKEGVHQATAPTENALAANCGASFVRTEPESGAPPPSEPEAPWHDSEAPSGSESHANGYDHAAGQQHASANGKRHGSDGHLHGDSGPKQGGSVARWVYQHPEQPNYLRVDKHVLPNGDRKFYQHHWNGARWVNGVKGTYAERKIPYRLVELKAALQADPNVELQLCEGEKDADSLARLGYIATTNPGGALSWTDDLTAWLRILGVRRAVIHEDNDAKGRQRTAKLTAALSGFIKLRVARYPDTPEGEDVTWWLEEGKHTKEELRARIDAAEPAGLVELDKWDAGELLNSGAPEPRQWLMSRQFCRGFLSGLVAPGDVGKTTLRLTQAVELAAGRELLGNRIYQRCRVLVLSLEDDRRELHRRLLAICRHHQIAPAELSGWLFCRELNGVKLVKLGSKGERELGELDHMLRGAIERRRPDLVILDPFVKLHALNENDNPDMDFVCSRLVKLAQDYNIAVDSPAHTHKGTIAAGDADARRGASAQRDAGRLDFTLTAMTADEADRFGIDPDERKSYVRLDRAKANLVRAIKASWFRLIGVSLDNATTLYPEGDEVQAIDVWIPPDVWEDLDAIRVNLILDKIDAGLANGVRYSADGKAKKRAAWKIIVEIVPEKNEAQAREIIKAWVKSGLLISRPYENPGARKEEGGLFVDPTKRPA